MVRQAHHERIGDEMNGWMGWRLGLGVGCVRGFLIPHCVRNDRGRALGVTGKDVRNDRGGAFGMVEEIVVVLEALDSCFRRNDGMGFRNVRENIRGGGSTSSPRTKKRLAASGVRADMGWRLGMAKSPDTLKTWPPDTLPIAFPIRWSGQISPPS